MTGEIALAVTPARSPTCTASTASQRRPSGADLQRGARFTRATPTAILVRARLPIPTMHPNTTRPAGAATFVACVPAIEQALVRLYALGLVVGPVPGNLSGKTLYTIHIALTRADAELTQTTYFAGLTLAGGNEEMFAASVESAQPLRNAKGYRVASGLPAEAIDTALDELRVNLAIRGVALYVGEYAQDGVPDAIVAHLALTEDQAFASHVALLAGLQWRRQDPSEFEQLARAFMSQQDGGA